MEFLGMKRSTVGPCVLFVNGSGRVYRLILLQVEYLIKLTNGDLLTIEESTIK